MAQSSSGAPTAGTGDTSKSYPQITSPTPSISTSRSESASASRSVPPISVHSHSHTPQPRPRPSVSTSPAISASISHSSNTHQRSITVSTALGPTSNCVEYERLVGKIMRDNFWDLDPFTVGLNPGLLNFDKPFIRSKAPHIRGKMRLLERILARMVEDEHLLLVSTEPKMYRPHPNRSTIDYLVIGDDPPWIPHFFNGSLAFPHVDEAMNSIQRFLDSDSSSQPPSRVPTVGVSRASSSAINRFKAEELPSCEEYIDFVHAVVQSISSPKSTGTIREDHFFPSMAVTPVAEVRKRANLVMRLMCRMVEDNVLTRVSAEEGTYVLHPECRPKDYTADRGLTDISHWVWTFKTWAVLDHVAEKAVKNLEKFLKDLSPAERSKVKVERENTPPPLKLQPKFETTQDNDVVIMKQEKAVSSSTKNRAPKSQPIPRRQKHKRSDREVSSSSSRLDQSEIIHVLTFPKSLPPLEMSASSQIVLADTPIPSVEIPDDNSASAIHRREKQTFEEYFQTAQPPNQQLMTTFPSEFNKLHISYPNDAFEVVIEKTMTNHIFRIICHDCDGRRVATKIQGSIAKLQIHLNAESHVSNVMSKLHQRGELPIETLETTRRMEVLKQIASPKYQSHRGSTQHSNSPIELAGMDFTARRTSRPSTSPESMELLQAIYGLPSKAFHYEPSQPRAKASLADRSNSSSHQPTPVVQQGSSRLIQHSTNSLKVFDDAFRTEVSKRFQILEESSKKKKRKLDHYGTLLGQTNIKYEEIEKEISELKSRGNQHAADLQSLGAMLIPGIDNLVQTMSQSKGAPDKISDNLDALLARDEQHESRWEKMENFRVEYSTLLQTLSERQDGLDDKLAGVLDRDHSAQVITDIAAIDRRIRELESSRIQLLESHNEMEQENRIILGRLGLLEQHDMSVDGATQLITDIFDRVKSLETARNQILAANGSFAKSLESLVDRIQVTEQNGRSTTTIVETVRESLGPLNESIDLLNERFSAQDKHIESLTKKVKKFDEWVKYFSEVADIQKNCIEDLQKKQATEARSRRSLEQRMEELLEDSKERENKMAQRLKALETKEERSSAQIALLKIYSTSGSVVGSDNGRGGSSTPRSSSQMIGAASTVPRIAQLTTGGGTMTPIRPPSRTSVAASISRPPSATKTTVIRPQGQYSNAATPIRPPVSSQMSINGSKNSSSLKATQPPALVPISSQDPAGSQPPKSSQPLKSTQPLIPKRKPRKF